jgi:hypothetical protein
MADEVSYQDLVSRDLIHVCGVNKVILMLCHMDGFVQLFDDFSVYFEEDIFLSFEGMFPLSLFLDLTSYLSYSTFYLLPQLFIFEVNILFVSQKVIELSIPVQHKEQAMIILVGMMY